MVFLQQTNMRALLASILVILLATAAIAQNDGTQEWVDNLVENNDRGGIEQAIADARRALRDADIVDPSIRAGYIAEQQQKIAIFESALKRLDPRRKPSGGDVEREPASTPKPPKKPLYRGSSEALLNRMYNIDPNTSYKELDCTQFMAEALERSGFKMTDKVRKRIFMADVAKEDLKSLVSADSSTIRGAAGALVESGQATYVSKMSGIQPGDVVQYWYKTKSGAMKGHTGIVERNHGNGVIDLYGSHKSKGGVGTLEKLDLNDADKAYVAHPSK
jgi:hypothetical protein